MSDLQDEKSEVCWPSILVEDAFEILDKHRVPLNAAERASMRGQYAYYGANGQVDSVNDYRFDGQHILVAEDGGYFDDPSRNVAYPVTGRFWVNNHAHVLKPRDGLDFDFLLNALNSVDWMKHVSGTTRLKLTLGRLRKVAIRIPPAGEQKRIAHKIGRVNSHRVSAKVALEAIPPLLEKFRQSVLAAAFRGDLTADWRRQNPDVEPASVLLERIRAERRQRWEDAELAKMRAKGKEPKDDKWKEKYILPGYAKTIQAPTIDRIADVDRIGWAAAPLESLVDPTRGIPYGIVKTGEHENEGIPCVRCGDIKDFVIAKAKLKRVSPSLAEDYRRTYLNGGEVLIAIRGTVGACAIADQELVGANVSREVAMIPLLRGCIPKYLMYLLASPQGQRILIEQTKGVAQQGINLEDLRTFPVPLPPFTEQELIVKLLEERFAQMETIRDAVHHSSNRISTLSQSILAKAFRGELVPQDPNDEPASVLLERIRAERAASPPSKKRKPK